MANPAPVELVLRAVGHCYGEHGVVTAIDLQVRGGEVVALLGPNGSGKTTLLRAASKALRPTTGAVYLNGRDLATRSPAALARELAALEQEIHPGFDYTVREVVELGRLSHTRRLQAHTDHDRRVVARALTTTDTARFAARPVLTLSSGERQRVWLAMALAQEPRALLLDEPTAFLDPGYQITTMELIRRLAAGGIAVLLATHDLSLAAAFAHRLVLLHGGRVVASGTPREVLTEAHVAQVYRARVRLLRDAGGNPVAVVPRIAG